MQQGERIISWDPLEQVRYHLAPTLGRDSCLMNQLTQTCRCQWVSSLHRVLCRGISMSFKLENKCSDNNKTWDGWQIVIVETNHCNKVPLNSKRTYNSKTVSAKENKTKHLNLSTQIPAKQVQSCTTSTATTRIQFSNIIQINK